MNHRKWVISTFGALWVMLEQVEMLELPFGNPNDYARSGHLHSTATVPESSSSLSYLHCITYD